MIIRVDGEDATLRVLNFYVHSNWLAGLLHKEISGPTLGKADLVNKDYGI